MIPVYLTCVIRGPSSGLLDAHGAADREEEPRSAAVFARCASELRASADRNRGRHRPPLPSSPAAKAGFKAPTPNGEIKKGRHDAAPFAKSLARQFGTAVFGLGGKAALLAVPRSRSRPILSALSSDSFGGT